MSRRISYNGKAGITDQWFVSGGDGGFTARVEGSCEADAAEGEAVRQTGKDDSR